jgi:hypothetical protein
MFIIHSPLIVISRATLQNCRLARGHRADSLTRFLIIQFTVPYYMYSRGRCQQGNAQFTIYLWTLDGKKGIMRITVFERKIL